VGHRERYSDRIENFNEDQALSRSYDFAPPPPPTSLPLPLECSTGDIQKDWERVTTTFLCCVLKEKHYNNKLIFWFRLVTPVSCKKSSKTRGKTDVKVLQIHFVLNRYRRKSNLGHTAIEFFCSGPHMIDTCPKLSCLTALICFLLFKGPGSFKKS
jgi:hypothetical protein